MRINRLNVVTGNQPVANSIGKELRPGFGDYMSNCAVGIAMTGGAQACLIAIRNEYLGGNLSVYPMLAVAGGAALISIFSGAYSMCKDARNAYKALPIRQRKQTDIIAFSNQFIERKQQENQQRYSKINDLSTKQFLACVILGNVIENQIYSTSGSVYLGKGVLFPTNGILSMIAFGTTFIANNLFGKAPK